MIRRFFCALVACLCICGCALAQDTSPTNEMLRLHIVAADDSPAAQALKLQLRDTCLRCAEACLEGAPDAGAAYIRLQKYLPAFRAACEARARELGWDGAVAAETGVFTFPDRIYGGTLVPAGDYRALKITIGEGAGHNWWCVLYPGLCWQDETAGEDPGRILAWLRSRLGGSKP